MPSTPATKRPSWYPVASVEVMALLNFDLSVSYVASSSSSSASTIIASFFVFVVQHRRRHPHSWHVTVVVVVDVDVLGTMAMRTVFLVVGNDIHAPLRVVDVTAPVGDDPNVLSS